MKKLLIVTAIAMATGCATAPKNIGAGPSNLGEYSMYSCEGLMTERGHRQTDLTKYVESQKKLHQTDLMTFWTGMVIAWPVILVPVFTPDYKDEILALRGKMNSIDTQLVLKECS